MKFRTLCALALTLLALSACIVEPIGGRGYRSGGYRGGGDYGGGYHGGGYHGGGYHGGGYYGGGGGHEYGRGVWRG